MQSTSSTTRTAALVAAAAALCLLAFAPLAEARKMSVTYTTALGPISATNPIGVNHTVNATVMRHTANCDPSGPPPQIVPEAGATVQFKVISGPNQGLVASDVTDAQGHATFTFTSSLTGTDKLVATPLGLKNTGICNPDGGAAQPSKTVEAIWVKQDDRGGSCPADGTPQIKIDDVRVKEGNTDLSPSTPMTFTVSLTSPTPASVTVAYATSDGTAVAFKDYIAAQGKVNFAPCEVSRTITIAVRGDKTAEANETFNVNLSSPANATLADPLGIGTIMDDDPLVPA